MFNKAALLILHAVTAIHAGSGSELGLVDLPIQREKHTGYPKIESSSLKGAIRATVQECLEGENQDIIETVFGKEASKNQNDAQAGAIALADARILLFPVKSLRGVFAWVTCPMVLERLNEEMRLFKVDAEELEIPAINTVSSARLLVNPVTELRQVVLEEYTYPAQIDPVCSKLATQLKMLVFEGLDNGFVERLMVIDDNDFLDFVTLSTEVNARIRIGSNGTVQEGALWYEENVPPESVFYSFCFVGKSRLKDQEISEKEVLEFIQSEKALPPVFQLGGNSTLGRGILRRVWK